MTSSVLMFCWPTPQNLKIKNAGTINILEAGTGECLALLLEKLLKGKFNILILTGAYIYIFWYKWFILTK